MNDKELIRKLMYEIGLDIDKNNYIIDQDNNNPIMISGKKIKYSFSSHVKINNNTETFFNPLNNIYLITSLFSYYLSKLEYEHIYFPVFFTIRNDSRDKHALVVKNQFTEIQTNFYYNVILAYVEMIFKIKGDVVDLSSFDSKK